MNEDPFDILRRLAGLSPISENLLAKNMKLDRAVGDLKRSLSDIEHSVADLGLAKDVREELANLTDLLRDGDKEGAAKLLSRLTEGDIAVLYTTFEGIDRSRDVISLALRTIERELK